mmetsp:Transcript_28225/g.60088  ORF Transcript_28225/g.60088 Transcript_28225/m.60088 type:complete len:143 (-) Transcript_28225:168-596(-)
MDILHGDPDKQVPVMVPAVASGTSAGIAVFAMIRSRGRTVLRAGLGGFFIGGFAGSATGLALWNHNRQRRRHNEALVRIQATAKEQKFMNTRSMSPTYGMAPVPEEEFNQATGTNPTEENAKIMDQIHAEDRVTRKAVRAER